MKNYNIDQLELFIPGEQGWKTPIPNPRIVSKPTSPGNELTKTQLQERYGVPSKVRRTCKVGTIVAWNVYLIWHQGRDCWKVYAQD